VSNATFNSIDHESPLSCIGILNSYAFTGSPGNPATPVGGCRYDSSLGVKIQPSVFVFGTSTFPKYPEGVELISANFLLGYLSFRALDKEVPEFAKRCSWWHS
jgi:hypothetical protein